MSVLHILTIVMEMPHVLTRPAVIIAPVSAAFREMVKPATVSKLGISPYDPVIQSGPRFSKCLELGSNYPRP